MNAEVILNLFQIVALAAALFAALRMLGTAKRSTRLIFFCFAVACFLFSDFYWLVYGLLRPDTRMPFAANEVCEWAVFLLLGASLNAKPAAGRDSARWEMLGAALFTAANTALWIAWSGEWMQDLFTGLCFGWYLCCLAARLKRDGVFSRPEWLLAGLACLLLIAAQTATFFVPETAAASLDLFCCALLSAGALFLLVKTGRAMKNGRPVCPAFAALAWTMTAMYMSEGAFYLAAVLLCTLCILLMLLAIRKEAEA